MRIRTIWFTIASVYVCVKGSQSIFHVYALHFMYLYGCVQHCYDNYSPFLCWTEKRRNSNNNNNSTRNVSISCPVHWERKIYSIFNISDNKVLLFIYLLLVLNWNWIEYSIVVVVAAIRFVLVYTLNASRRRRRRRTWIM